MKVLIFSILLVLLITNISSACLGLFARLSQNSIDWQTIKERYEGAAQRAADLIAAERDCDCRVDCKCEKDSKTSP